MKVAVPIFGERVSPAFDWALSLIVVEVGPGGAELGRSVVSLSWTPPFRRPALLVDLGVDVLLCGGVSAELGRLIEDQGVRLVPWVAGSVDKVLGAFLTGGLPDPRLTMPGCRGRCARSGGRRRSGRRRGRGRPDPGEDGGRTTA